jgi:sugar phosphate isomerase/epimerase
MKNPMHPKYSHIIQSVQVNIPFTMLVDDYLEKFLEYRLNPEISLDAAALDRFSRADFQHIADALEQYYPTITLHAPFIDLSPGSSDPEVRKLTRHRLQQTLDLVPLFHPLTVVCHPGYDAKRYGFDQEEWIQRSLETGSWLADELHALGSQLMLENVFEHHPREIGMLMKNLGRKFVGFCLDTGHVTAFSKTSLKIWIEKMAPFLRQIHWHDNNGVTDDHVGLGKGTIDFQPLMEYLTANKNSPPIITLEPHTEENLWDSLEYLEKVWPVIAK